MSIIDIAHHFVPHPAPHPVSPSRSFFFFNRSGGAVGSHNWTAQDTTVALCIVGAVIIIGLVLYYFVFREEPVPPGKFKCAKCDGLFDLGDDKTARTELKQNFGNVPTGDCVMVCDDCYKEVV